MKEIKVEQFNVIGVYVRTTNKNQQSADDIDKLWEKFWKENILSKIPNKISNDIFCVYTEYEGDFTQPYTTLIGCKTDNLHEIPDGMKGITIEGGTFLKLTAKGKMADGIVIQEWSKIWESNIRRKYKADFEVYGIKSADPDNAEIDIFVQLQ